VLKIISFIVFLNITWVGWGQSKEEIDALNNINFSELISDLEANKVKFIENTSKAKKINYVEGEAKSKVKLATVLFYLKEVDQGLQYSIEAIQYYEKQKDWPNVANCYADIGYLFKESNLDLALSYFRKALFLSKKYDVGKHEEKILNNYGVLQMLKQPSDLDSAIFYHMKAYEIAKELNLTVSIPYSLNNLVTVYSTKQDFDKAFYYLEISDSYRQNDTLSIDWADNLAYRADVYFEKQDYMSAILYYKKSLKLAQDKDFINLVKFCFEKLSDSNEKLGQVKEALFYLKALQNYKDSIGVLENNLAIAKIQENYDVSQKEQQILKQEAKIIGQKNKILVLIICVLILIAIGYFIYRKIKHKQVKLKQQVEFEKNEADRKLQTEKLRISRDLHDNIGSQLTYVISSLDNLNYIKDENKRNERLVDLEKFTKNTLNELRETIWTVNAKSITIAELYLKLSEYINRLDKSLNKTSILLVDENYQQNFILNSEQAINCFRSIQELITNAIKYSEAKEIKIVFEAKQITITDNGIGFNINTITKGHGLNNIMSRMNNKTSSVKIESINSKGTRVNIAFF